MPTYDFHNMFSSVSDAYINIVQDELCLVTTFKIQRAVKYTHQVVFVSSVYAFCVCMSTHRDIGERGEGDGVVGMGWGW